MIIPEVIVTFDNEHFQHRGSDWVVVPGQFDSPTLTAIHQDDIDLSEGVSRRSICVSRGSLLLKRLELPEVWKKSLLLVGVAHPGIYKVNSDEEERCEALGLVHIEDHNQQKTFFGRLVKSSDEYEVAAIDLVETCNMQPEKIGLHTILF